MGFTGIFYLAAGVILGGADYLRVFDSQQLQSLAYLSLKLHAEGYGISLIFFGVGCEILGYLVYRSGYLPRSIGILLVVAGWGYLFNSFAGILAPSLAASAFPWTLLPGFVAELALCLWLLLKGIDTAKWGDLIDCRAASLGVIGLAMQVCFATIPWVQSRARGMFAGRLTRR